MYKDSAEVKDLVRFDETRPVLAEVRWLLLNGDRAGRHRLIHGVAGCFRQALLGEGEGPSAGKQPCHKKQAPCMLGQIAATDIQLFGLEARWPHKWQPLTVMHSDLHRNTQTNH